MLHTFDLTLQSHGQAQSTTRTAFQQSQSRAWLSARVSVTRAKGGLVQEIEQACSHALCIAVTAIAAPAL